MKIFALLLIFSFVFFAINAEAQTKKHTSKSSKIKTSKKSPRTISAGVINGKAINLVIPEYPKSARVVNVYGQVLVQVLIDENGKVISAKVNSGHPILQSVSVKAALNSTFEPVTLSGETVRFSGIIIYNFTPREWNWLEIGFALNNSWSSYYSLGLSETLPLGFEEEKQLLRQSFELSANRDKYTDVIITSISGKLIDNEKSNWLFSVGLILGQMTQNCCRVDEKMLELTGKLKILLQSKSENISNELISNLERLVLSNENPNPDVYNPVKGNCIYQILKDLEQKFPYYN